MDYVVYGTGYGATLMLLGYAIRSWGPGWRFRDDDEAAYDRREFRAARSAWHRFAHGLGSAVATAGAALVILTFILMLVNPGDSIGSTVALSVTGLLLIGIAVWAWIFFSRFGTWGIVATPDALGNEEPARYDSRVTRPVAPAQQASATAGEGAGSPPSGEANEETDVADDRSDDLVARATTGETRHPDDAKPSDATAASAGGEEWFEAHYSKFESHHPEGEAPAEGGGEAETEEIDAYVEALTPLEVSQDIVDKADEEPVGDAEASIETYEELARGGETSDVSVDAVDDDPLEVLPEAHEIDAPLLAEQPDTAQGASGREDALRRLRERQAQGRQRSGDDA